MARTRTNMHVDPVKVGKRIRKQRLKLGLSQRDLQGPGISNAYISRIERGQRIPSLSVIFQLAVKLEVSAFFLLTGKNIGICPCCGTVLSAAVM